MKGESSGHTQAVKDIAFDCDGTRCSSRWTKPEPPARRLQIVLLPVCQEGTEPVKVTEPRAGDSGPDLRKKE